MTCIYKKGELGLRLNEIINLYNAIKQLIDNTEIKISTVCKFRLLTNLKSLEIPMSIFEAVRNEKIQEYGTEKEDGTCTLSKDDKETYVKFVSEINTLLSQEHNVQLTKIKAEDIIIEGINSDLLMALYPIIEE